MSLLNDLHVLSNNYSIFLAFFTLNAISNNKYCKDEAHRLSSIFIEHDHDSSKCPIDSWLDAMRDADFAVGKNEGIFINIGFNKVLKAIMHFFRQYKTDRLFFWSCSLLGLQLCIMGRAFHAMV